MRDEAAKTTTSPETSSSALAVALDIAAGPPAAGAVSVPLVAGAAVRSELVARVVGGAPGAAVVSLVVAGAAGAAVAADAALVSGGAPGADVAAADALVGGGAAGAAVAADAALVSGGAPGADVASDEASVLVGGVGAAQPTTTARTRASASLIAASGQPGYRRGASQVRHERVFAALQVHQHAAPGAVREQLRAVGRPGQCWIVSAQVRDLVQIRTVGVDQPQVGQGAMGRGRAWQ